MGKTFRNIYLASTNDFEPAKNDKIKGWVEHHGGKFAKEITEDVTHLVASTKAWKRYHPLVREARRRRHIRIVSLDWLEDSLLRASKRPLDTAKYEFEQRKTPEPTKRRRVRQRRKYEGEDKTKSDCGDDGNAGDGSNPKSKKQASPRKRKPDKQKKGPRDDADMISPTKDERVELSGRELDAACTEFKKEMGLAGYHPFIDQSGFVYLLTLVRKDILKNRLERHRLKVRYAPDLFSIPELSFPFAMEHPDSQSRTTGKGASDGQQNRDRCSVGSLAMCLRRAEAPLARPILPPCPVPLHLFPTAYPYSTHPVVASCLPFTLTPSNPDLRVHIPDPWAQGLQLFESDSSADAHRQARVVGSPAKENPIPNQENHSHLRSKSFACYTIYSRPGHRHVQTLAPPGSTFEFAWDMFSKFFHKRVGVEWKDHQTPRIGGADAGEIHKDSFGGEDGTDDDDLFTVAGPLFSRAGGAEKDGEDAESPGANPRKPIVTVLMNMDEGAGFDETETKAKTPEGGW